MPAGDLLVEHRPPLPVQGAHQHRDQHAGERRHRGHDDTAAEDQRDTAADHAGAEHDRPARQPVAGRVEPRDPGAGLGDVDVVREDVVDQVLGARQVVVVDVALADVAGQQHRHLVGVDLVAHPQQGEGHVDVGVAQPEVVGDAEHRRGHVGRTRSGGEQDLPDPEREIEDLVGLARVSHSHRLWLLAAPLADRTRGHGETTHNTTHRRGRTLPVDNRPGPPIPMHADRHGRPPHLRDPLRARPADPPLAGRPAAHVGAADGSPSASAPPASGSPSSAPTTGPRGS